MVLTIQEDGEGVGGSTHQVPASYWLPQMQKSLPLSSSTLQTLSERSTAMTKACPKRNSTNADLALSVGKGEKMCSLSRPIP